MKFFTVTYFFKSKKQELSLEANSRESARILFKQKFPKNRILSIKETTVPLEIRFQYWKLSTFSMLGIKNSNSENIIAFLEQLYIMLNAGISVLNSLKELEQTTKDIFLKKVLDSMITSLDNGKSFSKAFQPFKNEFGSLTILMIELGDKTGNYASAIKQLVSMLKEIQDNRTKFTKAMAYPRNILIAMIIAFIVIITVVIPKFSIIFNKFQGDLPFATEILLMMEFIAKNYGEFILLFLISFFMGIRIALIRSKKFQHFIDFILLKIKVVKDIIILSSLHRFNMILLELIRSGIPIYQALEISIEMVENSVLRKKLNLIYENIHRGGSLSEGYSETNLFENMVVQMIFIGENSGQLESMLKSITEYYKRKFDEVIENISSLIEPFILLILAGFILILALGVFMPVWDLGKVMMR